MLPLVCNDASAIFFMFDLSRKSTLTSVKEWYRQARGLNRPAVAFLVGTKYDVFTTLSVEHQEDVTKQVRAARPSTARVGRGRGGSEGVISENSPSTHVQPSQAQHNPAELSSTYRPPTPPGAQVC